MKNLIYCLGDSNTWGYDPRSFLGDRYKKAWCDLLGERLNVPIYNDGVNGRSVKDVLYRFPQLKHSITLQQPELLILLLGTNDVLMGEDPQEVSMEMSSMLQKLREDFPQLSILLLSPPPVGIPGSYPEDISRLSELYRRLASDYSLFFTNLSGFSLPLCYDGVHLTEEGHRLLGDILKTEVRRILSEK